MQITHQLLVSWSSCELAEPGKIIETTSEWWPQKGQQFQSGCDTRVAAEAFTWRLLFHVD